MTNSSRANCDEGSAGRPVEAMNGKLIVSFRLKHFKLQLMQLTVEFGDRVIDQYGAALLVERGGDDLAGGRNRDVGGNGADLGQRLRLLLGDTFLRQSLPAAQSFLELTQRARRDPLCFLLGVRDDRLGLGLRRLLLTLIGGERPLRLLAQIGCGLDLLADTRRACVERTDNSSPNRLPDDDDKDRDRQQNPKFRVAEQVSHQPARSAMARPTAASRLSASGTEPVTFSAIDRPTSTAMSCISASARCFAAAICCSAAAVCRARVSPSCRCRSAASAAKRSVVCLTAA